MIKRSFYTPLSYPIPEEDKNIARKIIKFIDVANEKLNDASQYLNLLLTPFKKNQSTNPDEIMKNRLFFRNFRDKAIDNFNKFKVSILDVIDNLEYFSTDSEIIKIKNSAISMVGEIQEIVNEDFIPLFSDLKNEEFGKKIIEVLERLQKKSKELSKHLKNRIKTHLEANILDENWLTTLRKSLNRKIQNKRPLLIELFQKDQEELNKMIKNRSSLK